MKSKGLLYLPFFLLLHSAFIPVNNVQAKITLSSPNGQIQFNVTLHESSLRYSIYHNDQPVIEPSPMEMAVDGVNIANGISAGEVKQYEVNETYPWRGIIHSQAVDHCNGAILALHHIGSGLDYTLEVRSYNDGVAYRLVVPGNGERTVSSEATTFQIPQGSTVWFHDFYMHYEGKHAKHEITNVPAGNWAVPPLTVKLPNEQGYASITEAALVNYSGMGLQANGRNGFSLRLGHEQPPSYPYVLRYGDENAERLSKPAAIQGTITTPWRVVMIGSDLNTLVNCDILHNLNSPPDPKLFPDGMNAEWLKPGRAVWGYLNNAERSLEGMKELSRLAGEMGFEYHVVEGHWSRWSEDEQKEFVNYSKEHGVKILLWKHSKSIQDPQERRAFFAHCKSVGAAGMKLDFYDHEAKETIDFYQVCLREAAEHQLIINFHGANKPTGESRTWPNELVREAVKGLESRGPWAVHNTTLPFTRMLAGHADYTAMHFGDRRTDTTETHQIASAVVLGGPLLVYAEHPREMLNHPAVDVIKQIPAVWDETIVLPASEIGEAAVIAKRSGEKWFLSAMNGSTAKQIQVDLNFLDEGDYTATFVRDKMGDSASVALIRSRKIIGSKPGVEIDQTAVRNNESLYIDLIPGGGFMAVFSK